MKTRITNSMLLPALIAVLNLILAGRVTAQTFTVLHSFTAGSIDPSGYYTPDYTNSDGINPSADLIITNSSGTTLYGTARFGGTSGSGTVFAVHADGTDFTNLHSFSAEKWDPSLQVYTNSDGSFPDELISSGTTLYGTAGTVFTMNTDGTGFTNLSVRVGPEAGMILSGSTLYGTTVGGFGAGTVFKVNTDGTGFTNLHNFGFADGAEPHAGVILSGNTLYGTTEASGPLGGGTVFAVNTDGTDFTNLHSFNGNDGASPNGLLLSGNALYGTTSIGGNNSGTVFALNTDGTGFTNLHRFTASSTNQSGAYTNSDGLSPGGLILSGNTLYGTATQGGSSGNGTVFALNTDGMVFVTLHNFTATSVLAYQGGTNSEGAYPGGLILSGNTLYGTAYYGGSSGNGTVFSLSFRPQLTITPSGTNVILSWPLSFAGFSYGGYHLQETANLASQGGWISVVDTNLPVIINGRIQVTRPMLGPQWSYRLAQ